MKRNNCLFIATALIICTLFTAVVWYLYYKTYFTGLILNDAMDYAGIARNVARGQGFISQYITPLGLEHHGIPQPDLWRAPLWPLALAGFQKLLGFIDEASAFGSGFFFVLTSPLVFLLARQWFGGLVAVGSVLAYTFTPMLLEYSISGMTEPIAVFLMALTVLVVSSKKLQNKPGDWLSGISLGLFYLARYNGLIFLPFFLIYRGYIRKKSLRPVIRMFFGFTLAVMPWLIRNSLLFGNPFFSLQKYEPVMFTRIYPDYSLYLYPQKVDTLQFILNNFDVIMEKVSNNWLLFRETFFTPELNGVTPVFLILFIISLFIPLNKKAAGIRPLILLCYITQLAALLVIHFIPRLFLIFTPFYIIFALAGITTVVYYLAKKLRFRTVTGLIAVMLMLFLSFQNFTGQGPPEKEIPDRERYLKIINQLSNMVPTDQVVLTNEGHLVSWYGDRYACKIPYSTEMIPEIQFRADVGAMFISDRILWHMPEAHKNWKEFYYQRPKEISGLKLIEAIPNRGIIYK